MAVDLDTLFAIQQKDPDGWVHRTPTDEDYATHKWWAIETYGQEAWDAYVRGGWYPSYSDE